jgi:hypothetical protein
MAHWKNLANYNYMGAYSFDGKVKEIVVTIKSVAQESVTGPGGKADMCIVAHFVEDEVNGVKVKPMIFNKTNCKAVEKALGTGDIEDWVGKRIVVFETTTKWQRELVPCLRVKDTPAPKKLKATTPAPAPEPEPEPDKVYACSICGKIIDKAFHDASVTKYGVALCSAECKATLEAMAINNNN